MSKDWTALRLPPERVLAAFRAAETPDSGLTRAWFDRYRRPALDQAIRATLARLDGEKLVRADDLAIAYAQECRIAEGRGSELALRRFLIAEGASFVPPAGARRRSPSPARR